MTTDDMAFGANQATQELKQAQKMATSLNNLANATIQKNTTMIDALVATNATLTKTIAYLQMVLARMYPPGTTPYVHMPTNMSTLAPPIVSATSPGTNTSAQITGAQPNPMRQDGILLVSQLQSQGRPQEQHMHIRQDRPPTQHYMCKHNGWQHLQ